MHFELASLSVQSFFVLLFVCLFVCLLEPNPIALVCC